MALAEPYEGQSLMYLRLGTGADFTEWGEEFLLNLAGDLAREYQKKLESQEDTTVN
jgi:hypothetical protein